MLWPQAGRAAPGSPHGAMRSVSHRTALPPLNCSHQFPIMPIGNRHSLCQHPQGSGCLKALGST